MKDDTRLVNKAQLPNNMARHCLKNKKGPKPHLCGKIAKRAPRREEHTSPFVDFGVSCCMANNKDGPAVGMKSNLGDTLRVPFVFLLWATLSLWLWLSLSEA